MTNELELLALLIGAWSLVIYYTLWKLISLWSQNAIYALAASRQNAAAFHEMFGCGPPANSRAGKSFQVTDDQQPKLGKEC